MKELEEKYKKICDEYIEAFLDKHDLSINDYEYGEWWIGNEVGGLVDLDDCTFNFDDIRYDVDHDIPGDQIFKWYWNSVERYELGLKYMNYPAFCKGAPDPIPADKMKSIRESKQKIESLQRELKEKIDKYKDENIPMFNFFD